MLLYLSMQVPAEPRLRTGLRCYTGMYTRWAERHGYTYKLLDWLDGEEAGMKNATISISGENAYGYLKSESGVHRLVRVSPFDASGRRHTSFAAIEVMPEIEDEGEIEIRAEGLKG